MPRHEDGFALVHLTDVHEEFLGGVAHFPVERPYEPPTDYGPRKSAEDFTLAYPMGTALHRLTTSAAPEREVATAAVYE